MTAIPLGQATLLALWGTIVGLDLVSLPQALLSRPLVVGTVAGVILGDVEAGLRVGVILELFALDVLPIGAVRYPDFGPGVIAATVVAAGAPWEVALGLAVALGLTLAVLGGASLQWLRHANARAIQRQAAALAAGHTAVIRALEYTGIARDALRGLLLTALGMGGAVLLARYAHPARATALALTLVAIATGITAAAGGALRSAGKGLRLTWLLAGLGVGVLLVALR